MNREIERRLDRLEAEVTPPICDRFVFKRSNETSDQAIARAVAEKPLAPGEGITLFKWLE